MIAKRKVRGLLTAALMFAESRALTLLGRRHFEAFQSWRLRRWLRTAPQNVKRYEGVRREARLEEYPIMDKAALMNDFEAYNVPEIRADQGWEAFSGDRMVGDYHVGASTGTSGNRGLYVISDEERFAWLGAILAKAMPNIWKPWAPPERVAVILPLHTRLYDAAENTGRVVVKFFDLTKGPESWAEDLYAFAPTTLVAPPKILRWLAERWEGSEPVRMFSGAEVLDDTDRSVIEARFLLKLGQIYMATEGLLAVSCPHGSLHLCEDVIHFELDPVEGTDLVSPIITDFRRRTQIMLRYRMNDLLRMDDARCACGSPCRVVKEVIGRQDDVFTLNGGDVLVTPDVLRNAVLDADRSIDDFRIVQVREDCVAVHLKPDVSDLAAQKAKASVHELFSRFGAHDVEITVHKRPFRTRTDRKLRRVEGMSR